ncbi:MAG: L,D-transpeptidase family protein, partial [Gemmatimonadales bacterium]
MTAANVFTLRDRALWVFSFAVLAGIAACDQSSAGQAASSVPRELAAAARPVRVTDSVQLAAAAAAAIAGARPPQLRNEEWKTVARLYRSANPSSAPAPLWLDRERLAPRANELVAVLDSVATVGLRPDDYAVHSLRAAVQAAASPPGGVAGAETLARADVLLTSSFVALVNDLLVGRLDPRKVEPSWHIAPRVFDVSARIEAALDSVRHGRGVPAVLAGLRPDYGSYGALLQALARYRTFEQRGSWLQLPVGQTLRLGATDPRVSALRRRLAAEGFLSSLAGGDTLDATLSAAVAEFQRKHGLVVDSMVGAGTRTALNVPASARVRQIEANLERMRWLPPDPGDRFVVVNVPAFMLYAFDGTKRVLTMRVVVGDELASRRTPIFADTMEYIQFGPYWNVPRSIAVNEILPQARRDRGYLARNNYEILRGWGDNAPVIDPRTLSAAALSSTRYRVRQKPGPDNALGRVKFMFPNDYSVYLHDTPSRSRFEDTDRAASHGCVRVADPSALAAYVLQDRADWPPERIAATLAAG